MKSRTPRQAVVVIHGIGEPRPLDTLRHFVTAVAGAALGARETERRSVSKPDYLSPTLELRRMALPDGKSPWTPSWQAF
jgi:hypothetical protein